MKKMKRIKVIRKVRAKRDIKDVKGWTIPKGTVLHITKEGKLPKLPGHGDFAFVARVDNGTGMLDAMPETSAVVNAKDDIEEVA